MPGTGNLAHYSVREIRAIGRESETINLLNQPISNNIPNICPYTTHSCSLYCSSTKLLYNRWRPLYHPAYF